MVLHILDKQRYSRLERYFHFSDSSERKVNNHRGFTGVAHAVLMVIPVIPVLFSPFLSETGHNPLGFLLFSQNCQKGVFSAVSLLFAVLRGLRTSRR